MQQHRLHIFPDFPLCQEMHVKSMSKELVSGEPVISFTQSLSVRSMTMAIDKLLQRKCCKLAYCEDPMSENMQIAVWVHSIGAQERAL